MIIEGFEIENWTCIKKLAVSDLPSTGVIVLHGPNRRGKSSLVKALRACLMDYASNSKSGVLKDCFPRGSGETPTVSVTFRAGETTYRIKKCFGSNQSELASRTSTGDWRVETTSAMEAHGRVCELAGGDDSGKGLRQLLWLTQAEFRLPKPKDFDANVQAQLRGILGVLQTPLDDRFIENVKDRWNEWHGGQRKSGKQHKIKDGCHLAQALGRLAEAQAELAECEREFNELEELLGQTIDLEVCRFELERQLREQKGKLRQCQLERERCRDRIAARKLADQHFLSAQKERTAALDEQRRRTEAAHRLVEAQEALLPDKQRVDGLVQKVRELEERNEESKTALKAKREERRSMQQRVNSATAKLRAIDDEEHLKVTRTTLEQAESIERAIIDAKAYLAQYPIPDEKKLNELKAYRQRMPELEADRKAASMILRIVPEEGAQSAQLALDGGPLRQVPGSPSPSTLSVRRKAELHIPDWGRVELSRGTGTGNLDDIEGELQRCKEEYSKSLASFGIVANEPDSFDRLQLRIAEYGLKNDAIRNQRKEFKKFAPDGIEPLQRRVRELETRLKDASGSDSSDADAMPIERDGLNNLEADLNSKLSLVDGQIVSLEEELKRIDAGLKSRRAEVENAKLQLARSEVIAKNHQEELDRLEDDVQIAQRVDQAKRDLLETEDELRRTKLTAEESTVDERLATCQETVKALEEQLHENEAKSNRIRGRLEGSEGLHARRTALSARVDELTRLTERSSLEKDAVDRLYELFEECREKQLGTLMGPIHDRVLSWMRVLDIGDYKEVRFSEAFLPDKLVRRDGTGEFGIDEESTGAQEQIGMLVRVALGSLLTTPEEPAVAILDDPLTHCDVGRLHKMRGILRRAAEGDSNLTPPAGPLQIIILTCHPEWFRDDRATVIDLEDLEVMQRFAV